jgi:hypothetical protein
MSNFHYLYRRMFDASNELCHFLNGQSLEIMRAANMVRSSVGFCGKNQPSEIKFRDR